jgi:hypothetical protein
VRIAAKVDRNQSEIVAALEAVGASVILLHRVGQGCPDLLVGYRMENHLLEVKDGTLPPSARKLTDAQMRLHINWRGGQIAVVESVADALRAIRVPVVE